MGDIAHIDKEMCIRDSITGVTKFAQVGIFSNLNHLNDISLAPQYAALCGMTLPEIEATFQPELYALAEANKLSYEDTIAVSYTHLDVYKRQISALP